MRNNTNPLADAAVRAAFLAMVAKLGDTREARRAFGLTTGRYFYARRILPGFAAAVEAARAETPRARRRNVRWTPAMRAAFLAAIVETGSAARAALKLGVAENHAHRLRCHDSDFAAGFHDAVEYVRDRVADRLRAIALNGAVRTRVARGRTVVTITPCPDVMLRVLALRGPGLPVPNRWVEITPALMARARDKLATQLRLAAAGEIAFPEDIPPP